MLRIPSFRPRDIIAYTLASLHSIREKTKLVLKATKQHARNLASFAVVYKSAMITLRYLGPGGWGKEGPYDTFLAGLLGGYIVFARNPGPVSQQVSSSSCGSMWLMFQNRGFVADMRLLLDRDIRLCSSDACTCKGCGAVRQEPAVASLGTKITRVAFGQRVVPVFELQLGLCDVPLPLVSGDHPVQLEKQYDLYVS